MPGPLSRERMHRPIPYRDRKGQMWSVAEIAELRVVSPAIDGPNRCLVIRFEREGEVRFARWLGDSVGWRGQQTLHRLFASTYP